jgi:hypothetical protein
MAKMNGFLGSLSKEVECKRRPRRRRTSAHHDEGMAIDLRYNASFYPPEAGRPASFSKSYSASNDDLLIDAFGSGSAYEVESFSDDDPEGEVPVWGTGQLEELEGASTQQSRSRSFSDDEAEGELPVWGTGQLEELEGASTQQSRSRPFSDEEAEGELPVWGTGQLEELAAESSQQSRSRAQTDDEEQEQEEEELPWGTGQLEDEVEDLRQQGPQPSFTASVSHQPANDPDTLAFAQDLQAILSGQKSHPSTVQPGQSPFADDDEDEIRPQGPRAENKPTGLSHEVFDRMGKNMSMATTFDLGSFPLERQFAAFDQELDRHERPTARPTAASVQPSVHEFAEDLSLMATPSRAFTALDLSYEVPLVPQQTGMSCWAAGCAMIVGWRDQMSVDPAEVARASGHWAQYRTGLLPEDASVFPVWGMAHEEGQSYTVQAFYDMLNRYGPLWVASAEPGPHIRVVTGMRGDGTPDGTTLFINDPWERGMATFRLPNAGAQYTETYTQFVQKMETLARTELHVQGIYVAHNRTPRS